MMMELRYFPSPRRYAAQIAGSLALAAFFALFHFIPFRNEPVLRVFGYLASAFLLYQAMFKATYVLVRKPSLVLDAKGIQYRISAYRIVVVPWQDVERVAVETSNAQLRGKTLSARFISVYPGNRAHVLKQMPLVQRFFGWLSSAMGYSPLFIHELAVDAPLEHVANAIRQHKIAFEQGRF